MRTSMNAAAPQAVAALFVVGLSFTPRQSFAQGCEPIRFTAPINLGGEGEAYQEGRQWRLTLAYRRLMSDEFFVGTESSPTLGPGGEPSVFKVHTLVADVAYSVSDRVRLRLSVPFSDASFTRKWPDQVRHTQKASGIGDVSLMGDVWLFSPRGHSEGNVSFGLGVKAPTGSHTKPSRFYTATTSVEFPADQTIQPGDGGWALLLQTQAFRQVHDRAFVYAGGSYMASPRARSDVRVVVADTGKFWSVPDVYSAKIGAAFSVLPDQGLTMSLGGRLDGIPVRDLIGGGDEDTIKRSSYIVYADPGLSLTRGGSNFTLSVPVRLQVNRQKSLLEQRTNGRNGGGFAKYLIFASYSIRL